MTAVLDGRAACLESVIRKLLFTVTAKKHNNSEFETSISIFSREELIVLTRIMSHAEGTRVVFVSVHPCCNSMSVISMLNVRPSGGTSRFNMWIETLTRWWGFNFPVASYRQFMIGNAMATEKSKQHTIISSWRISYLSLFLIFFPSICAYLKYHGNKMKKLTLKELLLNFFLLKAQLESVRQTFCVRESRVRFYSQCLNSPKITGGGLELRGHHAVEVQLCVPQCMW
jgi:hypothetical protein